MRRLVFPLLVLTCVVSAQTKKVIANLPPEMVAELAKTSPNVKIVPARGAVLEKEVVDADAMVGVRLTPELLKQAKQLKWLHISSAGVESHGGQTGLFPELVESSVVVTNATLVKALDSKRLAGAGLDATEPEPLPKGHPLWKFPNVVITPHTSGGSDNLQARLNYIVQENIRRFGAGLRLLNVVDKREGF